MSLARYAAQFLPKAVARALDDQGAGDGGGPDAFLTAALALSPVWLYDHKDITSFFSDAAMTTQAVVNGEVLAVADRSGNGYHRKQTTAGKGPTLRQAGSLYYLDYDGSNDFLVTPSIDLTAANALTLCMGAAKVTGNNNALLVENSVSGTTNNGTIRISTNGGSIENWEFAIRGTTAQGQSRISLAGSTKNVVTGIGELIVSGNLADQLTINVDGAPAAVSGAGTTGGVNYGNYPFYFGARGGIAQFFSGDEYGGALYVGKKTGADLAAIQSFVNNRTGI